MPSQKGQCFHLRKHAKFLSKIAKMKALTQTVEFPSVRKGFESALFDL